MNAIMGKLGNGVAQLLTPSAMKATPGEGASAGATAPTQFAALLSNVANVSPVAGFGAELVKAVATPVAATSTLPTDAAVNSDLLVADLPLTETPKVVPPKVAASDASLTKDNALPTEEVPKDSTETPSILPPRAAMVQAMGKRSASSAIPAAAVSRLKGKAEADPETIAAVPKEKDSEPSDPVVSKAPESVDAIPALTAPVAADVAQAISPGNVARAPARCVAETEGKAEHSTASAEILTNAKSEAAAVSLARTAPKGLPPEFAAALAASTKAISTKATAKPIADEPQLSLAKAVESQIAQPLFVKTTFPKEGVVLSSTPQIRTKTTEAANNEAPAASVTANAPPLTTPISPQAPSLPGGPVADVSASLGQQVIDMGSGGQWIDGLAREIAALSKGEGHGSFRLSPEHLGPMRVDIRPGEQGANVTLTVETKAAESMLMQDRNILKADAQLAAVKIGDVTVERVAHVHEPSRADTANGQGNSQGNGQGQTSAQTSSQGQNGQGSNNAALAQGQGQGGQSQQNGNHAGNRKVSADAAVSSQAEPRNAGDGDIPDATRRARYA